MTIPPTRGRGRPSRTGKLAGHMLRVRFDADEWRTLQELADAADLTMSDYVRIRLFGER